MSLITGAVLNQLWLNAQRNPSDEQASMVLWNQLWNKYVFPEEGWVVMPEAPQETRLGRRRLHAKIKYLAPHPRIVILAFHGASLSVTDPEDVKEAEEQALDACMRYLESPENEYLNMVCVVISFGTKGRTWMYMRDEDSLIPDWEADSQAGRAEYIELNSSDATRLRMAFNAMKIIC